MERTMVTENWPADAGVDLYEDGTYVGTVPWQMLEDPTTHTYVVCNAHACSESREFAVIPLPEPAVWIGIGYVLMLWFVLSLCRAAGMRSRREERDE